MKSAGVRKSWLAGRTCERLAELMKPLRTTGDQETRWTDGNVHPSFPRRSEHDTVTPGPELDIQDLLRQTKQMTQRLATAQRELTESTAQGASGGGLVKATVNGRGKLLDLEISSVIADPDNTGELARMIVSAVQEAHSSLRARYEGSMSTIIDSFGP